MKKHTPRPLRPSLVAKVGAFAALAAGLVPGVSPARAASATWTGGDAAKPTVWQDNANWSGDFPGTTPSRDIATFGGGGGTTGSPVVIGLGSAAGVAGNVTVNGLAFTNTAGLGSYAIGAPGDTLTLYVNKSAVIVNSGVAADEFIGANLVLGAIGQPTGYLINNGAGNLTITGNVTAGSGRSSIQIAGTGNIVIGGSIARGGPYAIGIIVSGNATVAGDATLILAGANTYAGNTIIDAGTMLVANAGALGDGRKVINIGNGGNITLGTGAARLLATGPYAVAKPITVNPGSANSAIVIGGNQRAGTATYDGFIALNNNSVTLYAAAGGETDFTGSVFGGGNLTINGGGTVKLSGSNAGYVGAITVRNGTLSLSGASASIKTSAYVIGDGATLDVSAFSSFSFANLGDGGVTIDVGSADAGRLKGPSGELTLGGKALTLSFGAASIASGKSYELFTYGNVSGEFGSVKLAGGITGSLTRSAGVWTGTAGGYNFNFTESTGVLSVSSASSIPEPANYATP